MAVDRTTIYTGDSFPVSYECRRPDPDGGMGGSFGLPDEPDEARAELKNRAGEAVELGGAGVFVVPAEIIPKTGNTVQDRGAIINFTVQPIFTQEAGDFTLYITGVFADGAILTEERRFKVKAKR
jgi:hypothetical protein